MLQFLFVFVLVSEDFLGGGFDAEIAVFWALHLEEFPEFPDLFSDFPENNVGTWRASIAHDAKYRDLSGTSLASRNGDGSLIQSNEPSVLLWISMEAILQIPRARKTDFSNGRPVNEQHTSRVVGYMQSAAAEKPLRVYLTLRLARGPDEQAQPPEMRFLFACTIFQLFLVRCYGETCFRRSITDLILNASALGTILEIDELVFASLLPKKIQVRYTRAKSQLEGTLILVGVVVVTLAPIFVWVMPLVDIMQQVKSEFCYGAQNFVVAYNQDEYDWNLIYFADDPDTFARDTVISQASISDQIVDCLDADDWPRRYGATYTEREIPRFHAAAAMIGRDNATTCAELADKCGDFSSRLLRSVCPLTCGCHLPQANQWFKVPAQGCPNVCRTEATKRSQDIPCRDSPVGDNWLSFWGSYPDVMQEHLGINFSDPNNPITGSEYVHGLATFMQTAGCPGLVSVAQDPITRTDWCQGNTLFASLAYICPLSCGCWADPPPDFCPRSCKACGDEANFPANANIASCVDAKQYGICGVPAEAARYCAGTCGICNGTANTAVCPDGPLPDLFGLGTCADVQAAGWCPLLNFLDSSVSFICGRSCGTCT
ncbi:unnamed protein product [Symbiodinium sp. CCMP2592]|nr:unnamed protein product [Symbiodinium sp. CCMP2592]